MGGVCRETLEEFFRTEDRIAMEMLREEEDEARQWLAKQVRGRPTRTQATVR